MKKITVVLLLILTFYVSHSIYGNVNPQDELIFYIRDTQTGDTNISLEDLNAVGIGGFYSFDLMVEPTKSDLRLGTVTGYLYFDTDVFEYVEYDENWVFPITSAIHTHPPVSAWDIGASDVNFDVDKLIMTFVTHPTVTNVTGNSGILLEGDTHLLTIKLKLKAYATENSTIMFDFPTGSNAVAVSNTESYGYVSYFNEAIGIDVVGSKPMVIGDIETEPDATLSSLTVGDIAYAINDSTFDYQASITYDQSLLDLEELITAIPTKSGATVTMEKTTGEEGSIKINDVVTITIEDTSGDGATQDHHVTFIAVGEPILDLSTIGFTGNGFSLSPAFSPSQTTYTLIIPGARQSSGFSIAPTVLKSYATIASVTLNGVSQTLSSNRYSFSNLPGGQHTVVINIAGPEGTTKVYTIHVTQQVSDATATLNDIFAYDGSGQLHSAESGQVDIPEGQSQFRFNLDFTEATIKSVTFTSTIYNGSTTVAGVSGNLSQTLTDPTQWRYNTLISIGKANEYRITLTATAENDSVHTYSFTVKREASSNTELETVRIVEDGATYTINPISGSYNYTVKDNDISNLTVLATGKSDENATVTIQKDGVLVPSGNIDIESLSAGTHVYQIIVAPQNGETPQTYTLNIIKRSDDVDFDLSVRVTGQQEVLLRKDDFTQSVTTFVYAGIDYTVNSLSLQFTTTNAFAKVEKISGSGTFGTQGREIVGTLVFNSVTQQSLTFTIRVTAQNTDITKDYEFTITRNGAKTINTLQNLTISGYAINGFTANVTPPETYGKTIISPTIGSIAYLEAIVTSNEETTQIKYEYKRQSVQNYTQGQNINIERGVTYDVRVTVTSQAGQSNIYQFQFVAANTDATMQSIQLENENGTTIPISFSPETLTYAITVSAPTNRIKVLAQATDSQYATIQTGADAQGFISLNQAGGSPTVVTIYAVSESGDKGNEYKITVTRTAYRTNADLSSLSIERSDGTIIPITFHANTLSYSVRMDKNFTSATVIATLPDVGSNFLGGGTTYNITRSIANGNTEVFSITVIAENGQTQKTYTVSVQRASNIAALERVVIDGNPYLLSQFSNGILTLPNIPFSKNEFEFSISAQDSDASIATTPNLSSGKWILTSTGALEFSIVITAQDGVTKETYRIRTNRAVANNDATLNILEVNSSIGNFLEGITPTISGSNETYRVTIPRGVSINDIISAATDSQARINRAYADLTLNPGADKTFTITVTAENGTTIRNYHIIVTQKNNNPNIESITINHQLHNIHEETTFNLGTFAYSQRRLDISVILEDSAYAQVLLNGTVFSSDTYELRLGQTSFTIRGRAEDGTSLSQTYTFTYTLNPENTDNHLDELSITDLDDNVLLEADLSNGNHTINLPNDSTVSQIKILAEVNKNLKTIIQSNLVGVETPTQTIDLTLSLTVRADGSINQQFTIVVQAENGTTKTYTITVIKGTALSSDNTISIVEVLDIDDEVLFSFTDFDQMSGNVLFTVSTIKLRITTQDNRATVLGETIYSLIAGESRSMTFTIRAEDGTESQAYSISIYRQAASTHAKLSELEILDYEGNNQITFDPDVRVYNVSLDRLHTFVTVGYEKGHSGQTIQGNEGNRTLTAGSTTVIQIFITAQDGATKENYTVYVTVKDTNSSIESINFAGQTKLVESGQTTYTFDDVAYTTNQATLDFTTSSAYALKTGNGLKALNVGVNYFVIYATSEAGDKGEEYTVIINREVGDHNTSLANLSVYDRVNSADVFFDTPFNPNNLSYTITLGHHDTLSEITIYAEAQSEFASITGTGDKIIISQNGVIFVSYKVIVTAQDGTQASYEINIIKQAGTQLNDDYEVIDVALIGNDNTDYFEGLFNQDIVTQLSVLVPYSVSSIQLDVLLPQGAILIANNNKRIYNLNAGVTQTIYFQSQAQDGTTNPITYEIAVTRELPDTNDMLESLTITENPGSIVHDIFDLLTQTHTIIVKKDTQTITIDAFGSENSHVTGGQVTISVTQKTHFIFVQAQDPNQAQRIYIIQIEVEKDHDASLSYLAVRENITDGDYLTLSPVFASDGYKYAIDLTGSDISEIFIEATANSAFAVINGLGAKTLKTAQGQSTETFIITVIAEDGYTSVNYEIQVTRDVDPRDDVTINELSLIGNNSINYLGTHAAALTRFDASTLTYELMVPYEVYHLNLTILNHNGAVSNRQGLQNLNNDYTQTTQIIFFMTSDSGIRGQTYTIVVTRLAPSDDASLSDLKINGVIVDGFDPDILSYEITVDVLKVLQLSVSATKANVYAVLSGDLGNINIQPGKNTINITVRAQDNSVRTYAIIVNSLSFDASINTLWVENHELTPVFDPEITVYRVTVAYQVTLANIVATAHQKATLFGAGVKNLSIGSNFFAVYARAENGQEGIRYQVEIIRTAPSSDTTLSMLVFKDKDGQVLPFTQAFESTTRDYIIELDEDTNIMSAFIEATATDSKATVYGTGNVLLGGFVDGLYHTIIKVSVMAEDGHVEEYTVNLYRGITLDNVAEIESLSFYGSDSVNYLGTSLTAETRFDYITLTYHITVPYYVNHVTLDIQALGLIYGDGLKRFNQQSTLEFTFYVVSQSGTERTETYTVLIQREIAQSDNVLTNLTVDGIQVPNFDPEVNHYEMNIPTQSNKTQITIDAATDSNAVIQGVGIRPLNPGINIFTISVRAEDDTINAYHLTINYVHSNALLDTLVIKGSSETVYHEETAKEFLSADEFDGSIFKYNILIDKDIQKVRFTGTTADQESGARVSGFRTYDFPLNQESRMVEIEVVSADGLQTQIYEIQLVRNDRLSNDSTLIRLSVGGYQVVFNPNTYAYVIQVKSDVSSLNLSAEAFNPNALISVRGYEQKAGNITMSVNDLSVGQNIIVIEVLPEDQSPAQIYTLTVVKEAPQDYLFLILLIASLFLWIITVLILLARKSRIQRNAQDEVIF